MPQGSEARSPSERILLVFAPAPGLPSASPYSTKAMILLEMAGLDFTAKVGNPTRAPKGKLPVLIEGGRTIPDSHFIRRHLETEHGAEFDCSLGEGERAVATALVAMAEDRLYFSGLAERWMYPENKPALIEMMRGSGVPRLLADPVTSLVTRTVRRALHGQGMGRHGRAEALLIGRECIDAFAAHLGDRPFMMGDEPTGVDASIHPILLGCRAPSFTTELAAYVEAHANLLGYAERMRERFPITHARSD